MSELDADDASEADKRPEEEAALCRIFYRYFQKTIKFQTSNAAGKCAILGSLPIT